MPGKAYSLQAHFSFVMRHGITTQASLLHPPASSSALSAARCASAALPAAVSCTSPGPSAAAAADEGQNDFCSPAAASEIHGGELTPLGD